MVSLFVGVDVSKDFFSISFRFFMTKGFMSW